MHKFYVRGRILTKTGKIMLAVANSPGVDGLPALMSLELSVGAKLADVPLGAAFECDGELRNGASDGKWVPLQNITQVRLVQERERTAA